MSTAASAQTSDCPPERIADVITAARPDIVALQELDVHRSRSGKIDQAHAVAERLEMKFHFYPAIEVEEEKYGDAILSPHPMQLMRAGILPTVHARRVLQPRGALWVRVTIHDRKIQVVNAHLGLNSRERVTQAGALLGKEWLGSPDCKGPVILCGDFNAVPGSPAYRRLRRVLRESQRCGRWRRRLRTYPTRYPILRLDHIFVGAGIEVCNVGVPRTKMSRVASDHYPFYADLKIDENNSETGT